MKKLVALIALFLSLPVPAQAATEVRLVATPTRLIDGTFRNDELYLDLLPEGKLGRLVFTPTRGNHTWVMDPELIDEIVDMSDGYRLINKKNPQGEDAAKNFLDRLRQVSAREPVIALPFGNPDISLANRLAPSELRFYYGYGKTLLENHLQRAVSVAPGLSRGKSFASNPQRAQYTRARQAVSRLLTVVPDSELASVRAQLAVLLSPKLNKDDRKFFYFHSDKAIEKLQSKLRISSGKYQLTSERSKMPITLVNEFNAPVTVYVQLIPLGFRITVEDVESVTVAAKSRLQLSVPFNVLAPGPTNVTAQLANADGDLVSIPAVLTVNSTIIDSKVAWFTTTAGILLLLAGVIQSVRRVRKAKHEGA